MKTAVILFFVIQPWLLKAQEMNNGQHEVINYNLLSEPVRIDTSKILKESYLQNLITQADNTFSFKELAYIIDCCAARFPNSLNISFGITNWLRENHAIYNERGSVDVNQFRGFLIYCLQKFIPNPELLRYLKAELLFSDKQFNLTASAHTIVNFPLNADELIPLLTPFLESPRFETVDITTFELRYPAENPTTLKDEIITTLKQFSKNSKLANQILQNMKGSNSGTVPKILPEELYKQQKKYSCCSEGVNPLNSKNEKSKKNLSHLQKRIKVTSDAEFVDQDGKQLNLII